MTRLTANPTYHRDPSFKLRAEIDDLKRENAQLRAALRTVEEYRERIRQLEIEIRGRDSFRLKGLKLSPSRLAILRPLYLNGQARKHFLHEEIERVTGRMSEYKVVDVQISHLRKALRTIDVEIGTIWGFGYEMTDENRARLRPYVDHPTEPRSGECEADAGAKLSVAPASDPDPSPGT